MYETYPPHVIRVIRIERIREILRTHPRTGDSAFLSYAASLHAKLLVRETSEAKG